jgi:hypothetical protein
MNAEDNRHRNRKEITRLQDKLIGIASKKRIYKTENKKLQGGIDFK